jgi:hypothetical protein
MDERAQVLEESRVELRHGAECAEHELPASADGAGHAPLGA